MNTGDKNDDDPMRFARNWLTFDEARPTRPRLLRNFIIVVAMCFAVAALLLAISQ